MKTKTQASTPMGWSAENRYSSVIFLPSSTSSPPYDLPQLNAIFRPHDLPSHSTLSLVVAWLLTCPPSATPYRRYHPSLLLALLDPISPGVSISTGTVHFLSVVLSHLLRSSIPSTGASYWFLSTAMNGFMNVLPPTPPSSPPPCTAESRIGAFIGSRGSTLQLKGILGTGAYGVVYSAFDHRTGTPYAVKALSKTNSHGEPLDHRQQDFQHREIRLHYAASAHPNIVSMHRIVEDEDCTYVVLEYCPEGDLFSNITEKGRYVGNDLEVRSAFLQILDAVAHCHHYGIFHRDLKPENILVSNSGSKVLLADFGLATKDKVSDDHGCGSTFYMSPGRPSCYSFPHSPVNQFYFIQNVWINLQGMRLTNAHPTISGLLALYS